MKKILALLVGVLAVSFAFGFFSKSADAANCYYRCICSVPHKCCVTNGVETCKPVSIAPIQCTQNFPC